MKRPSLTNATIAAAIVLSAGAARADDFSFKDPGDLAPGSGKGRVDNTVYAPGIRFPIEDGLAFANSQVWGHGGNSGPGGSQCDKENFSYPWRDNFCETRSWDMPLCPAGVGHQGQDIRSSDCIKLKHWGVAATDGTITSIGSYTVYLTAADGTRYDYLHMDGVVVKVGQLVKRGDHLGMVSNNFGGSATTVHLHFNIRQNVKNVGVVFVPPYMSIIQAYKASLTPPPAKSANGNLDVADCQEISGWAFDPAAPDKALSVAIAVDGGMPGVTLKAADPRQDLCSAIGSCNHGFHAPAPLSLFDGKPHALHFLAIAKDGSKHELAASPATITCGPIAPATVRRRVEGAALKAWSLSEFWDELPADAATLPEAAALPAARKVVADPKDKNTLWLIDVAAAAAPAGSPPVRRKLDAADADGWHIDAAAIAMADATFESLPIGKPMKPRAELVVVAGQLFLLDVADPTSIGGPTSDSNPGAGQTSAKSSCAISRAGDDPASLAALAIALVGLAARSRSRSRRNRAR